MEEEEDVVEDVDAEEGAGAAEDVEEGGRKRNGSQ